MSEGDTPEKGPQSILDAVEDKFPDLPPETPEAEAETAPDAEQDPEADALVEEGTPADADPEDAPEEPQHLDMETYGGLTVAVMIDGQERRVNLADVSKGYQRQADYSRKTEELATERRAMEAERGRFQADFAERERQLLSQFSQNPDPEPDWVALAKEDPLGYVEKRAEWDAQKATREQAQMRLNQQAQAEMHQAMQVNLGRLAERRPEWRDPETAEKARVEMISGGEKFYGFQPAEMNATIDHRLIEMLSDAVAYRRLKEGEPTDKRRAKVPKVIKPGTAKGTADVKVEADAAAKRKRAKPHTMKEHLESLGLE